MSIEPIPPELKQLIDAEPLQEPSPELEARLLARLDTSVDVAGAIGGAAGGSLLAKVGGGALLFLAGVGTGTVLHSRIQLAEPVAIVVASAPSVVAPAPSVVAPAPSVVAPAPSVVASAPEPAVEAPAPAVVAPRVVPAPPPKPVEPKPEAKPTAPATLESERRLLEPARTALGRGLASNAIELLMKHAAQFPKGQLAEERDAIWIQALAQSGDASAARKRAADFERSYPDSLFLPVVRRSVAEPR